MLEKGKVPKNVKNMVENMRLMSMADEGFQPAREAPSATSFSIDGLDRNDLIHGNEVKSKPFSRTRELIIANPIRQNQALITEKDHRVWYDLSKFLEVEEDRFTGTCFDFSDKLLIELVNRKNGKVTYATPPAVDANEVKFNKNGTYDIKLVHNIFTGKQIFYFYPVAPIELTKEQITDVIADVADSI